MDIFEKQTVDELNFVRTSPQEYSNRILEYTKYFKGTLLHMPGSNVGIQTKEGANAYKETAEYLENKERINPLQLNYSLYKIAKEFLLEVQKTDISEIGNIDLESIINKYGRFEGSFSRAIDFGGTTPALVISNLLVGDGDESRSQRASIFNDQLKLIGVATGKHLQFGQCTVILTCSKFTSKNPEDDNYFLEEEKKVNLIGQPTKLKSKPPQTFSHQKPKEQNFEGDPDCPEGVKKVIKTEKVIVEGGKRKKIIKTVKYMEDDTIQTEIEKEVLE